MTNKKLNFYFFGDIGEYDKYNPAYVCNAKYTPETLYLIAKNDPFTISKSEIAHSLNVDELLIEKIIESLELIKAIEVKGDKYKINFPVFLKEDVIEMENHIKNIGKKVGNKIIENKDIIHNKISQLSCSKKHPYERILYHVICDMIFDGTAFKFFGEKDIFAVSKMQPDNRDYIIVAYEDCELVESHSNRLLCSSNNYRSENFTFNSFGDSNGFRKDMFRYFRLIQKSVDNASEFKEVNIAYNKVLDDFNRVIAEECGTLICNILNNKVIYDELSEKEKKLIKFLCEFGYIDIKNGCMTIKEPIFYESEISTIVNELSDIMLISIFPIVKEIFHEFESSVANITPLRHKVDIRETANEVWHQIFGSINEYLVKEGFVARPDCIEGEGRYLRSIIIREDK